MKQSNRKRVYRNKYQQLQDLELRSNKLVNNAMLDNRFEEVNENLNSHLNICRRKWEALMEELRGWSTYQGDSMTKPEWVKYCKDKGLYVGYHFGDVMA